MDELEYQIRRQNPEWPLAWVDNTGSMHTMGECACQSWSFPFGGCPLCDAMARCLYGEPPKFFAPVQSFDGTQWIEVKVGMFSTDLRRIAVYALEGEPFDVQNWRSNWTYMNLESLRIDSPESVEVDAQAEAEIPA